MLAVFIYSAVLWLGLYLIGRNPVSHRLWLAGLGLVTYALILGLNLLLVYAPTSDLALILTRIHWSLLFLPSIFWFGATVYLLPETAPLRNHLGKVLNYAILPGSILIFLMGLGTHFIFDFTSLPPQPGPGYFIFAVLVILPLLTTLLLIIHLLRSTQVKVLPALLLLATLFFGLSTSLLLIPLNLVPRLWLLLGMSIDFIILGLVIAVMDAFEEGETLLPHFLRSLDFAASTVLLFGGLVALTMFFSTGITFAMLLLLLTLITLILLMQTFLIQLQNLFDRVTLKAFPGLQQERSEFRAVADALARVDTSSTPANLTEAEFARLTRRALSNMGNLPRLATSPLIRLPLIDNRLNQRQVNGNTLERAAELKSLLNESIIRLKPRDKGDFGTAEEWRHYNALYYPYVLGLKPYSRRLEPDNLSPDAQEALGWFRTYVPERTLYNWQNAAAKLVAKDLREGHNGNGQ